MDAIFKQYPELDEYFVTSDGQKFFHEGDAKNHAKSLENKAVKPVKRHVIPDAKGKNTYDDLIAQINKATSIEQVQKLAKGVNDAGVKKCVVSKIKELEKAIAEAKAKAEAGKSDKGQDSNNKNTNPKK